MTVASSDPSLATEEFGPYLVFERLGIGGMATVYRAKKQGIAGYERNVALKRMLSHLTADPHFVESFVREAKVASLLVHPNVAQVYDFGRIGGVYYIAMELVTGFDMRKLLRHANRTGEAIPLPVLLSILTEMCDALEYAHTFVDEHGASLGIVHRDISPSNLILAHTGHLKVIDFGIAKAHSRALHTESGQVKGKLGYMSPEAALGMPVGPASDVFSAGVVAWELITASPLFSSKSDFETMRRIREMEIPPPSHYNPACPPALDQVVLAALERDGDRRLRSAFEFRARLDEIAARARVQLSARTVAEWLGHLPVDGSERARRPSWGAPGGTPAQPKNPSGLKLQLPLPPEPLTQNIRPSQRPALRRTDEEAQLATEIWGEDAAAATYVTPGADFSADAPPPIGQYEARVASIPQLAPMQQVAPIPQLAPAPAAIPLPGMAPTTQMRAQMAPAHLQAHLEQLHAQQLPPRRRPLVIVLAVAIVATLGAVIGVMVTGDEPTPAPQAGAATKGLAAPVAMVTTPDPQAAPAPAHAVTPPAAVQASAPPVAAAIVSPPTHGSKHEHEHEHEREHEHHVAQGTPGETREHATHHEEPVVETPIAPAPVAPAPVSAPIVPPPTAPPPVPNPTPAKPARVPVVAASAVSKLSGELPQLRVHGDDTSGDVLAKMCIDERGHVSSAKMIKGPAEIAGDLQQALAGWSYKPYLREGVAAPVCFALELHVVVQRTD